MKTSIFPQKKKYRFWNVCFRHNPIKPKKCVRHTPGEEKAVGSLYAVIYASNQTLFKRNRSRANFHIEICMQKKKNVYIFVNI